MAAKIIDGKKVSSNIEREISVDIQKVTKTLGRRPKLIVVVASPDEASKIYVGSKKKKAESVGIEVIITDLGASASNNQISDAVNHASSDKNADAVILQLPLPKNVPAHAILDLIDPKKDVDGLTSSNMGKLINGEVPFHTPCTAMGVLQLIESTEIEISGMNAVVIGRSMIVGKPVSTLLLQKNATVTICHSKTKDIPDFSRKADILVCAVGIAKFVKREWVKPGAVVIDVGINRDGNKLLGDVDFDQVRQVAGYITPVPGGVGPMTVINLMRNVVNAAKLGAGIE